MSQAAPADPTPVALREPAHQVSPRAVGFWRVAALIPSAFLALALLAGGAAWWAFRARPEMAGTVELGALPPGVARTALNVVVVTLDTTDPRRLIVVPFS